MTQSPINCKVLDESLPGSKEYYGFFYAIGNGFQFTLYLTSENLTWDLASTPQYKRIGAEYVTQRYSYRAIEVIHLRNRTVSFFGDRPPIHCNIQWDAVPNVQPMIDSLRMDNYSIFVDIHPTLMEEILGVHQLNKLRISLEQPPASPYSLCKDNTVVFEFWLNITDSNHSLAPPKSKMDLLHDWWDFEEVIMYGQLMLVAKLVRQHLKAYEIRMRSVVGDWYTKDWEALQEKYFTQLRQEPELTDRSDENIYLRNKSRLMDSKWLGKPVVSAKQLTEFQSLTIHNKGLIQMPKSASAFEEMEIALKETSEADDPHAEFVAKFLNDLELSEADHADDTLEDYVRKRSNAITAIDEEDEYELEKSTSKKNKRHGLWCRFKTSMRKFFKK